MVTTKDLPDEILMEIFGFLSPKTLKNCNLVCKRWDEIISDSSALMDNYKLNLCNDKEVQDVNRKIQTIALWDVSKLDILRQFNLHTLLLHPGFIVQPKVKQSDLIRSLNCLKSLKVLDIKYADNWIEEIITENFQKVQLNIEELTQSSTMLHIFDCNTLKRFELIWESVLNFERRVAALKFLNQQKDLKEFELKDGKNFKDVDDDFFGTLRSQQFMPKFGLEKFVLTDCSYPFDRHEKLITFLNYHKNTLKKLTLYLHPRMGPAMRIQQFVLENLSGLKHLDLVFKTEFEISDQIFALTEDEPRHATNVTNNINSFGYNLLNRSLIENKRFIDMFGSLKHLHLLEMSFKSHELLKHLSVTKIQLESLSIDFVSTDFGLNMTSIVFPNLKSFAIQNTTLLDREIIHCSFIVNHEKTLEKITIGLDSFSKLIIDAIAKCKKLKFIELKAMNSALSNIKFKIRPNLSSMIEAIKKLPFEKNGLTIKISTWTGSITFKLPEDKIFWDDFFASQ